MENRENFISKNDKIIARNGNTVKHEGITTRNGENLNIECLLLERDFKKPIPEFHFHQYIELIYVLEGTLSAFTESKRFDLEKDSLLVIYPNELHAFKAYGENRYIAVKFLSDILRTPEQSANELEYLLNLNSDNNKRTRIIPGNPDIRRRLEESMIMYDNDTYTSELYIRSNILCVCAHILDFWNVRSELTPVKSFAESSNITTIKSLMSKIPENTAIRTHEAAEMCKMSDGHFSRVFKTLTGYTFTQYVRFVRLNIAERLLKNSNMSITEIAHSLNYATSSHFIEDFRKEKGISPKQYRKKSTENK